MKLKQALVGYDYELPLMDVLNDPELPVSRRLLAGAAIGEGLDTAYFATCELLEAFGDLLNDIRRGEHHGEGYLALEDILQAKNPFQMRAWYLVHELEVGAAMVELAWFKTVTYQRAQMAGLLREQKVPHWYTPARDFVGGPTAADWMANVTERN